MRFVQSLASAFLLFSIPTQAGCATADATDVAPSTSLLRNCIHSTEVESMQEHPARRYDEVWRCYFEGGGQPASFIETLRELVQVGTKDSATIMGMHYLDEGVEERSKIEAFRYLRIGVGRAEKGSLFSILAFSLAGEIGDYSKDAALSELNGLVVDGYFPAADLLVCVFRQGFYSIDRDFERADKIASEIKRRDQYKAWEFNCN